jgi:hypothetical protein
MFKHEKTFPVSQITILFTNENKHNCENTPAHFFFYYLQVRTITVYVGEIIQTIYATKQKQPPAILNEQISLVSTRPTCITCVPTISKFDNVVDCHRGKYLWF